MVKPIEQGAINARAREQKAGIFNRNNFLLASRSTQEKIVSLLENMNDLIDRENEWAAQKYFFHETSSQKGHIDPLHIDEDNVDWDEVYHQILWSCFGDGGDMEGYQIVSRRVQSQVTVFRALMDVPQEQIEYF